MCGSEGLLSGGRLGQRGSLEAENLCIAGAESGLERLDLGLLLAEVGLKIVDVCTL
jgi:hypothetical protein